MQKLRRFWPLGHQLFGPPKMSLFLRPLSQQSLISSTRVQVLRSWWGTTSCTGESELVSWWGTLGRVTPVSSFFSSNSSTTAPSTLFTRAPFGNPSQAQLILTFSNFRTKKNISIWSMQVGTVVSLYSMWINRRRRSCESLVDKRRKTEESVDGHLSKGELWRNQVWMQMR